jgi:hypothetical protein
LRPRFAGSLCEKGADKVVAQRGQTVERTVKCRRGAVDYGPLPNIMETSTEDHPALGLYNAAVQDFPCVDLTRKAEKLVQIRI